MNGDVLHSDVLIDYSDWGCISIGRGCKTVINLANIRRGFFLEVFATSWIVIYIGISSIWCIFIVL